jgi:5-amino-6-(5-phosphoribosylamino)uracil reductase
MKPYVICHMCTTIDGRILAERWPRLPGGKNGANLFESTADTFGIGAWLVGTTTMREFAGRNVGLKAARRRVERTTTSPTGTRGALPSAPTPRARCASRSRTSTATTWSCW